MTVKAEILAERLEKLRLAFREQLPERVNTIQALVEYMFESPADPENINQLRQNVHSLAGAGGSFGFMMLSEKARELEQCLVPLIDGNIVPSSSELEVLGCLFNEIVDLADKGTDDDRDYTRMTHVSVRELSSSTYQASADARVEANLIYIVEDDLVLAEDLTIRLQQFGYKTKTFNDVASAEAALKQRQPFVILVDLGLPEGELSGPGMVARFAQEYSAVKVIFMSTRSDWQARLACARVGGSAYFTKPIDTRELIDRLDTLSTGKEDEPFRVLIVDDVEVLARHYSLVLESAGVDTTVVTDVSKMLDVIINKKPELILMDLYMPECTGIEAARVIRQINEYIDVPIVFLSTENEVSHQMEAMKIGGDDFLHKPIRDDHLVASVTTRAQRFRHLRSVMERDSLTGLINHGILENELERELSRSEREQSQLVFAMVDIDHFKSVNDNHGHQEGDKVIKAVTRLLTQRLRKIDIIGRYGGEEFGVILPSTTPEDAIKLLDEIRESVGSVLHSSDTGSFRVTFSAGLAAFPVHMDVSQLIRAADNALYKAKQEGRNRVICDADSLDNEAALERIARAVD